MGLPLDVAHEIFSHFSSLQEIFQVRSVCKEFLEVVESPIVNIYIFNLKIKNFIVVEVFEFFYVRVYDRNFRH